MAKLIQTDGTTATVVPANGTDFTCEEIHGLLGGFFETIPCADGSTMLVDDEGKLKGLPMNPWATEEAMTRCAYPFNDVIAGPVLICAKGEIL